ncbi:Uncharacterised protein [Cedecea neteri]|uniref:Uncharacterized protein n=1 Tax=Cedecea neteri TaxID=158822 RepID=A0A2X3J7S7_9ENTR|nr:Uncharacterised protein [Cedecea neteri]
MTGRMPAAIIFWWQSMYIDLLGEDDFRATNEIAPTGPGHTLV